METCTSTVTSISEAPTEATVVKLRESGMSIANIMKETGLPERLVKRWIANVAKPAKIQKKVTKIKTPLTKATERVFILASRTEGIRDYKLRSILHEEYGATWDTTVGQYRSNYNSDTIKRVKAKVQERAAAEDCDVIFVMDWVDEDEPKASSYFLLDAGAGLSSRLHEYITEYMAQHTTRRDEDSDDARIAQVKQRYAVERHLLKLAVKGYSPEPMEKLLERTVTLVNKLEGTPDTPPPKSGQGYGDGSAGKETPDYYPEPSRQDVFLDFAESQGWIKEISKQPT
ncbi:hypothetical protein BOO88_25925 [Stutzerimonas stutzeri]|nr:hypothetical protein BOO89_20745 [Stutzerimonas stutzeri]AZO92174.1 hypothetical protein BOO88_25925 [Stutzerimonas stutzeri]